MIDKPPVAPAAPPAGDPQAFAEAHRQLLADRTIQFELPTYEPPQPPQWLNWLGSFFGAEHPLLRLLVYGLVAAIGLLILYLIVRWLVRSEFWRRWRGREDSVEDESWRPEAAPARALLSEADQLAAKGLFSEAAHLLLFRSIADIDSRRPDLVRPALTSRDIAALPAIPERPRGAFSRIAMLVERSLFARRPLAEPDWRDCRAAYEEFAFVDGWRPSMGDLDKLGRYSG